MSTFLTCVVCAHASNYCPHLQKGGLAAVDSEMAAIEAARPLLAALLTPQDYDQRKPFTAYLDGDAWVIAGTQPSRAPRSIATVTVCRMNGDLNYIQAVVD